MRVEFLEKSPSCGLVSGEKDGSTAPFVVLLLYPTSVIHPEFETKWQWSLCLARRSPTAALVLPVIRIQELSPHPLQVKRTSTLFENSNICLSTRLFFRVWSFNAHQKASKMLPLPIHSMGGTALLCPRPLSAPLSPDSGRSSAPLLVSSLLLLISWLPTYGAGP